MKHHSFNYGARYFSPTGPATQALLNELLHPSNRDTPSFIRWPQVCLETDGNRYHDTPALDVGYLPINGLTAIAKYLARDLTVLRQHRVSALTLNSDKTWTVYIDAHVEPVATAQAIVLAIPAPQAESLLQPLLEQNLPSNFLHAIQSVEFDPCFTVITGYSSSHDILQTHIGSHGDELSLHNNSTLQWVGLMRSPTAPLTEASTHPSSELETTRPNQSLIVVTQSSATFAQQNLETRDRLSVGHQLLNVLSEHLKEPCIQDVDWMQVHLWRYAQCRRPAELPFLLTNTPNLIGCAGDWCCGHQIEHALSSGRSLGHALHQHLI